MTERSPDLLTIGCIAATAFIVADLSHEALGHGIAAQLSGAKQIVLSYTYLSSDFESKWISGAGVLVNLFEGSVAYLLLRRFPMSVSTTYFIFLLMSFNLLDAAAYLVYSGGLNSGDLANVIAGWPGIGLFRAGMVMVGLAFYYGVTRLSARQLSLFPPASRRSLVVPAYAVPILLNAAAALLNPLGLKYFLLSALPTAAGANAGLLAMPALAQSTVGPPHHELDRQMKRSVPWITLGLIAVGLFIFVVGPGVTLKP